MNILDGVHTVDEMGEYLPKMSLVLQGLLGNTHTTSSATGSDFNTKNNRQRKRQPMRAFSIYFNNCPECSVRLQPIQ